MRTKNSDWSTPKRIAVDVPCAGLGDNADRRNVEVLCNGRRLVVEFIGEAGEQSARQVNVRVPERNAGEELTFTVIYAGETSDSASIHG
jgi:uncharacterized protein (TIGR03437 family)